MDRFQGQTHHPRRQNDGRNFPRLRQTHEYRPGWYRWVQNHQVQKDRSPKADQKNPRVGHCKGIKYRLIDCRSPSFSDSQESGNRGKQTWKSDIHKSTWNHANPASQYQIRTAIIGSSHWPSSIEASSSKRTNQPSQTSKCASIMIKTLSIVN